MEPDLRSITDVYGRTTEGELVASLEALIAARDTTALRERTLEGTQQLSGLDAAAIYELGLEPSRMERTACTRGTLGHSAPQAFRVDVGRIADILAGERAFVVDDGVVAERLPGLVASVAVAVPIRDLLGRPLALLVAWTTRDSALSTECEPLLERFASAYGFLLERDLEARRSRDMLAVLPQIADLDDADASLDDLLEALALLATTATDSDATLVRICDEGSDTMTVAAAYGKRGEAVADVIGMSADIDTVHRGDVAADPVLRALGGRALCAVAADGEDGATCVLQVVRRAARPFDAADSACVRLIALQVATALQRSRSSVRTTRATSAARSAIRLLGEALVAGVKTDRTLRFAPRLFQDMFGCEGCRLWQCSSSESEPVIVASTGTFGDVRAAVVDIALATPGELVNAEPESQVGTHAGSVIVQGVAAVGIEGYAGESIAVELALAPTRQLGPGERELIVDVAERLGEALRSTEQAAAQERQLERVRVLQDVIASAHETLSEQHVIDTLASAARDIMQPDGVAILRFADGGRLRLLSQTGVPESFAAALTAQRHWLPAADGEERSNVALIEQIGTDARLGSLAEQAQRAAIGSWSALAIPLATRQHSVGCLLCLFEHGLPEGLDDEVGTLSAFGLHIGSALMNARSHELEREARRQTDRMIEVERDNNRQIRALHEVARTFAASMSLDDTMRAVVESMADRLDVDAVWIRTPDERGDHLHLRAFYASHPELSGALERMIGAPDSRDDPVIQHVLVTRQPVLISGSEQTDTGYGKSEIAARLQPFLARGSSVGVLPIATPNEVLGTIAMLSIDSEHPLTYERLEIAANVSSQAALALDNARLYQQQKHFADVIQESLLPSRLPQIPQIDLGVLYRSASGGGAEVGGDFYDFLELDDGRLALVVGDVTGKGVAAAADTAMTKYIFRALAREHPSPSSFLSYANQVVCEEITPGKFVTLFYAIIDPQRNTMVCANAGHPEPKLVRQDGDDLPKITSVGSEGLALGIMPDQDYEQREFSFDVGTSLVVYTDGVVEARRNHRLYGQYRLERRLMDEGSASAPQIAFAVYQDCAAYAEDGLGDDVAIVVAQRVEPDDVTDSEA